MKNIIKRIKEFSQKSILVIGDVMLDEYVFGDVTRISPEAPVPVFKESKREWSLGGAANVALNCRHIGCKVDLVGVVGNGDQTAQKFISMLAENGISTEGLVNSKKRVTTSKKRIVANGQQLLRVDSEDNFSLTQEEHDQVVKRIEDLCNKGSIILVSDYAKGVLTKNVLEKIVEIAKEKDCLILLDPKGPDFDKYKNVNYLKPNLKEFNQILDFYNLSKQEPLIENAKKVCKLLSLDGIVVTKGEGGMQFVSEEEQIFIPACKREVFDITGAGDTVLAFLALGLSVKLPIKQCLKLSNHAAGVAVSHHKTYAVSLDELIDKASDVSEKIFDNWALLKVELDWLKLENKKIVFTNGCFDLLHSGHIHLLKEARKMGDVLVVAINTDDSVKRYKGEKRPIKTEAERARVMASIGFVDFIVFFNQDTPKELVEYLNPDVLVKGGDYKKEKVAGYDFMMSNGKKVEIVSFKEGFSTTKLVQRI